MPGAPLIGARPDDRDCARNGLGSVHGSGKWLRHLMSDFMGCRRDRTSIHRSLKAQFTMACCYIAASMIAFIIKACDALDINLELQYNDSFDPSLKSQYGPVGDDAFEAPSVDGATTISVTGMTCSACTNSVEDALRKVKGVQEVNVSLALQEARIFHESEVKPPDLVDAIGNAGFEAKIGERTSLQKIESMRHHAELEKLRKSLWQLTLGSAIIFVLGLGMDYTATQYILTHRRVAVMRQIGLFVATSTLCATAGNWILSSAWEASRVFRVNMHSLITASTLLGILVSLCNIARDGIFLPGTYYDTIAGVIFIVTAGRYCDLLSRRQATNTFVGLYSMLEESAILYTKAGKVKVQASMLRKGDEVVIPPFALIPCDGYIAKGESYVNESVMTGESMPIAKEVGDFVYAGSRNGPGPLEVTVSLDDHGSFLQSLVRAVETSLVSKVPVQHRIDVITNYFVLAIFSVALLSGYNEWRRSADETRMDQIDAVGRTMMTILAAACPCALGLATPCAVMAGIDVAWRRGILILDGGRTMQTLQGITHIVLDKTGTLTHGLLKANKIRYNRQWEGREQELAVLICAAEESGASSHPVGAAIFRTLLQVAGSAWKEFKATSVVEDLKEIPGQGVSCRVKSFNGKVQDVVVGSRDLARRAIKAPASEDSGTYVDDGLYVEVVVNGELAASITLQDTARPDAKATTDALKARGYHVSMLTGDNHKEASRISRELGIEVMQACATPETKLRYIQGLKSKGCKVVMIGDGMNDGPSLAASDTGIMMAHGTKCLSSGGGVLILNSQLRSVPVLLDIASKTTLQISFNVAWALTYNAVAILLALGYGSRLGITITPPIAAAMMSASSVSVTGLGLLLRRRLLADAMVE